MGGTEDRTEGKMDEVKGKIKEGVGDARREIKAKPHQKQNKKRFKN